MPLARPWTRVPGSWGFHIPGGRYVDALAQAGTVDPKRFPRPYLDNTNLDFSFSGLKTAVANEMSDRGHLVLKVAELEAPEILAGKMAADPVRRELTDICASLNYSVAETLKIKARRALRRESGLKAVLVAGGVAANTMVREAMAGLTVKHGLELLLPSPALCTDNAAMVAYAGYCFAEAGLFHGLDVDAVPRGRAVPWDYAAKS